MQKIENANETISFKNQEKSMKYTLLPYKYPREDEIEELLRALSSHKKINTNKERRLFSGNS